VRATLLVVAKAPVTGLAKTRLSPAVTPERAAEIAAAALLDTLDAVLATPGVRPVVALTGDLSAARREPELRSLLRRATVVQQRGNGFAERLVNAHADACGGLPVLQIGMDTPQVTPGLLAASVGALLDGPAHAVLGLASDGGWWALGLRDAARAAVLREVAMSTPRTGARTLEALRRDGATTALLPRLSDVDEMSTARAVAAVLPGSRFAEAVG
jgi:glycosyltransferase A (GT-A) superfamily protein (DUF2064 family)